MRVLRKHCCHETGEPCNYGWSDTHMHRCEAPQTVRTGSLSDEQDVDDQ